MRRPPGGGSGGGMCVPTAQHRDLASKKTQQCQVISPVCRVRRDIAVHRTHCATKWEWGVGQQYRLTPPGFQLNVPDDI